jgi:hypothetical protein
MLYFSHMNLTRSYWQEWKNYLLTHGFSDEVSVVLEALSPFGFLISQFFYMFGWVFPENHQSDSFQNLAKLFEDRQELSQFSKYLLEREI